jgi:uncharacterized protein (DUF2062 family)
MFKKIQNRIEKLIRELLTVKEPPHEVALSFAMGVFLGILPFTGVVAAITLAWAFKLNKAAAVLGSAITNTWVGLIALGLAIKAAVGFLGIDADAVHQEIHHIIHHFHWHNIFQSSFVCLLGPVAIAFFIISFLFAFLAYVAAYVLIIFYRKNHTRPTRGRL